MTLSRRTWIVAAGSSLLAPAAAWADRRVAGSGTAATQRRDLASFTGIALGAPFSVVLRQGTRESVEIVADDNLLPLIETKVSGRGRGTLSIGVVRDAQIEPRTPVVVTIDFVKLDAIALGSSGTIAAQGLKLDKLDIAVGGSGKVSLTSLDTSALEVSIGGSGRVTADGQARTLSVNVAGSGRCDLERLVAGDVSVAVVGSGMALVNARNSLSATIAGSGDVRYRGDVTPSSTIIGSGRLKRL